MSDQNTRLLPVRPDLDQLKHQAKDLLRNIRRGDSDALAEFDQFHPAKIEGEIKLADVQAPSRIRSRI